jgi:hypothetical protein
MHNQGLKCQILYCGGKAMDYLPVINKESGENITALF